MKKVLACIALASLTGCCAHEQRFVQTTVFTFAFDTKTGQTCISQPKAIMAPGGDMEKYPYCSDLAKAK